MPESRSRKHEGVYFVVVDGVPRHCQWQELKDYLRDFAKVRPGHTNVIKLNEDGTRVGYCPLPNKIEAYRAFDYLVAEGWQGLDIRVSVIWKTDLHSQNIQRKRGPEASRRRRSVQSQRPSSDVIKSESVQRLQSNISPIMRLQSGAHQMRRPTSQPVYSMESIACTLPSISMPTSNGHAEQGHYPITFSQYGAAQISTGQLKSPYQYLSSPIAQAYDYNINEQALNLSSILTRENNPTFYKDRQSIHISKLRHDIKSPQLKKLLARYGQVSEVAIKRGKEKRCSATARYQKPSEALLAIQELNGKIVDGLELVVRHDRSEDGNYSSLNTTSSSSSQSIASKSSDSNDSTRFMRYAGHHYQQQETYHRRQESISQVNVVQTNEQHEEYQTRPNGPLVVNGARETIRYRKWGCAYDDDSESAADSNGEGTHSTTKKSGAQIQRKSEICTPSY